MILVKKCKFRPNLILCQIVKNLLLIGKGLDMKFDDVVDKKLRNLFGLQKCHYKIAEKVAFS